MTRRLYTYLALVASVIAILVVVIKALPTANESVPHSPPDSLTSRGLTAVSLPAVESDGSVASRIAQLSDADLDSWDSETVTEVINGRLKTLAKFIEHDDGPSDSLNRIVSDDYQGSQLLPDSLAIRFRSEGITVRGTPDNASATLTIDKGEFGAAVRKLTSAFEDGSGLRVKFKLFQIERGDDQIMTRVFYEADARSQNRSMQQNATWQCRWRSTGDDSVELVRIVVERHEEAESRHGLFFEDCTKSVLSGNRSYAEQIVPGVPYWASRVSREFMTQFGHHGVAVGDVNGDGLDDIYVCDAGGLPNRLFVQQADGTAVDVSEASGVNLLEDSVSALLVDLDNDGDQDLVVATDPLIHFAENDGRGRFSLHRGYYANTDSYSMSAADFDRDGDLDIYVCGYNARKQDPVNRGLPFPLPYHDANNGGRNYLLRNEGGFRFADATHAAGLDEHNTRFSLAAAWDDFDNDNDLDLYVANDFGRNNLYRNDGHRFQNVAASAGVEDHASGMSVAWGDYDRDGWVDIHVSNMFSAAGNRVTFQRRFSEGLADETVAHLRRMSRGNTLFRNLHDGTFQDVSESAAVTMGRWAWASRFADLNNDGWLDLLVANGYVTNDDTSDL